MDLGEWGRLHPRAELSVLPKPPGEEEPVDQGVGTTAGHSPATWFGRRERADQEEIF